jgi:NAD(P)-dependent dehydrogenase (short-subunit alcohol dehydrogenase family)
MSSIARQRFLNKISIVSGGASGIGRATVERLAGEGSAVAIFDINKENGEELADELKHQGKLVDYYQVDVSDKETCSDAVTEFAKKNGGIVNYLVNSAVYFGSKGLSAEKSDWTQSFNVNVTGYANMLQACYPMMTNIKDIYGKSVVNIASISAFRAQPQRWTYAATKGAIAQMTRCMALDLSVDNIRVNSVSPAWVWSPEVSKVANGDREKWEPIWGNFHMPRRLCETSEVAAAICFLLSDDASYITGTDLPVDGGYMSMGPEGLGEHSHFAGTDY